MSTNHCSVSGKRSLRNSIREELVGMKLALDEFTYEDVESLKENIQGLK